VALLLCAPAWFMTDCLAEAARPVRALGLAATAGAIVAVGVLAAKRRTRPRAFAAASGAAVVMTLAAVAAVGPDAPRQTTAPQRVAATSE
jgi:hypothetical protein